MANYKQKTRVKGDAQDQSLPTKNANAVTSVTSLGFVKTMLQATMGTFLYLRYIFPDDHFETMELRKEALVSQPAGDMLPPSTQIADDSQIPASQQITKPLVTRRVAPNGSPETNLFLERLEGITEAVGLGYLRSFILYIILDPDRPNQVLETVTFNFTYSPEGPSCILTRDVNNRAGGGTKTQSAAVMTNQQVYKAMKAVIRDFVKESQDMPDLPGRFKLLLRTRAIPDLAEKRCLNFKVFYTDDAPAEYQVRGFQEVADDQGLVFGTHDRYEVPAELAAHTIDTSYHGLSVRLASIAGHLKPSTNIEALGEAGTPRSAKEQEDIHQKHQDDSDLRVVVWDAETSVIDPTSSVAPLGVETQDGFIRPLAPSQARSQADSDEGFARMHAKGHGERHTNLLLVPQTEPWGMGNMFIATQEAGGGGAPDLSESQETMSIPSDPETQNRSRSARVTGSLSQVAPLQSRKNESDGSGVENRLISSDEHTDPSSQEFATSKDTFRGASTAPPAHKVKKARSARAPSTGAAPISRSALIKKAAAKAKSADKAAAKPRAPKKKKAAATGETTAAKSAKAKAKKPDSDESPTTGSSIAACPAKAKKKAAAKEKATVAKPKKCAAEATTASDESARSSNEEEGETACSCGHNAADYAGEYIMCDGCGTWKHAVCMGALRPEKLGESFECLSCRIRAAASTEDVITDSEGDAHILCLIRRVLVAARWANEVVPGTQDLCKLLGCGVADVSMLLKRLVDEGFLLANKSSKGPMEYVYQKTDYTKREFSRYFNPGGSKERQEIPILADASQPPSSQLPSSQLPFSQAYPDSQSQSQFRALSQVPNSQLGAFIPRRKPTSALVQSTPQEDIEVDETPLDSSVPNKRQRDRLQSNFSPIPESDPIEAFDSTYGGQGTLLMEVDDSIDATPLDPTPISRRFDRSGKRKADDQELFGNRPTARIRSATGIKFFNCPFVEI